MADLITMEIQLLLLLLFCELINLFGSVERQKTRLLQRKKGNKIQQPVLTGNYSLDLQFHSTYVIKKVFFPLLSFPPNIDRSFLNKFIYGIFIVILTFI